MKVYIRLNFKVQYYGCKNYIFYSANCNEIQGKPKQKRSAKLKFKILRGHIPIGLGVVSNCLQVGQPGEAWWFLVEV